MKRQLEKMGTAISKRDMMIHILGTLPSKYETTIDLAEKDCSIPDSSVGRRIPKHGKNRDVLKSILRVKAQNKEKDPNKSKNPPS